jgi:predicted RNA-binding protein with PUA-like domain
MTVSNRYWLFKTEPSTFSIDHLAAEPDQTTHWEGVRNYQARNMLVAGTGAIAKAGYPDFTAWDPQSPYFDPKSSPDAPTWYMVDVKLKSRLDSVLPLPVLKQTPGLENMMVCRRGMRLSIQPVTADEWRIIQKLMKDFAAGSI